MLTRPIPSTGESLPVIGVGTWSVFDVAKDSPEYERLPAVLDMLFRAGGSVIDSSPMYGRAEAVTGELLSAAANRKSAFLATKVWTEGRWSGRRQMRASFKLLRADTIDLLQIHNLVDWRMHLPKLRALKAEGRIRYIGITHYVSSAYRELEEVMRAEPWDFVQVNYHMEDRAAAERILPLAADRGMAVIVNKPFGGSSFHLRRLLLTPLPGWAAEIGASTWAQLMLKFVLSHPAVTCTIPGTGKADHMADDVRAAVGIIPDASFWSGRVV